MGKLIRFRRRGKSNDAQARPLFPPFRSGATGTDARPSNRFPTDAVPSDDLTRANAPVDAEVERKRRLGRSGLIAAGLVIFAGGTAAALFGDRGYVDVQRERRLYSEMKRAHDEHLERLQALQKEIQRLKTDPSAVERIAREQLGYVAKNEVTLLLPGQDEPAAPRLDATPGSAIVPAVRRTP